MKGCNKQQESILNTLSLRKEKFQTYSQSKEDGSANNKKSSSLMSICQSKLKEPVYPQIVTETRPTYQSIQDTKKSRSLRVRSPICTTVVKVHGSPVSSALEAVNQYAEKVRMTMVKEHKILQQYSSKQLKHSKLPSENATFAGFDNLQELVAPLNNRNAFLANTTSSMAYKTINLLYKTLVGNHSSRRKNRFELDVSKLPIVDRNSVKKPYHSHQKYQKQPQPGMVKKNQPPLDVQHNCKNEEKDHKAKEQKQTGRGEQEKEKDKNGKAHGHLKHRGKLRVRKNPMNQEQIEIIPWATMEDLVF